MLRRSEEVVKEELRDNTYVKVTTQLGRGHEGNH